MNQRMEQTHKATLVGQLSSMIAHELAQPLSAISYYLEGAMELVKRNHDESGLLASSLEKIRVQTDRMGAIVGKVRSYAKSDAKRDIRVDLSGTLKTVLSELRMKGIGGVQVASSVPEGLAVRGDPLEIELLLWNLLKNATEAALGTGHPMIEIEGAEKDGVVYLQIENSGPVMTEEDVKNLDSPLQSKKPGGTGLGLHIAESIAEATGGGLSLKPRTPNGLRASLHLPSFHS
jgi:two-component system sensor histidine kinase TtrS